MKSKWILTISLMALSSLLIAFVSGCQIGVPYQSVTRKPSGTVVVALTDGVVDRGKGSSLSKHLRRVLESIPASEGLIGYSVRKEIFGRKVWTQSAWTDEAALERFVYSKAHRDAMRYGGIPRETVRSATVDLPASELPLSWKRVREILDQQNPAP